MSDVTRVLGEIECGDPTASERLLPLVYDELRKLARSKLARENPGHTLQATALVHEAYLRLVGDRAESSSITANPRASSEEVSSQWDSRGHFFAAAAEAMRRILVESARRKLRRKHGGELSRQELDEAEIAMPEPREDLLALDAGLNKLTEVDRQAAEIVQLRYFAGMTIQEAANSMKISPRSADRLWSYARAWLHQELERERGPG